MFGPFSFSVFCPFSFSAFCLQLHAELSSLGNENRLLRRQLEVVRREVVVVKESLEGQLETQTEAVRTLRERVAELSGVRENWEAEQERVKVSTTFLSSHMHTHTHITRSKAQKSFI